MDVKPNHFLSMRDTKEIQRKNNRKYTVRANRSRFFFPDEWMAFFDKLKAKQQHTFMTLINTGARINEARNIKVSDILFDRNFILLRVTKRVIKGMRPKLGVKGKTEIRTLMISSQFAKYLKRYISTKKLSDEDYIGVLSTPAANIGMKKALRKAGIQDWDMFSVHNVRKTLETWLLSLDIDSFKIIKHFGHTANVAIKHYVSSDIFNWEDKQQMRKIIGDLYGTRQ